ncbi:hypothetical protein Q1695_004502 [Nippostrongylus brasiliensis]|nr:hypothetical protein Q1695_004502 [Nippostrongylus brasiliensis]
MLVFYIALLSLLQYTIARHIDVAVHHKQPHIGHGVHSQPHHGGGSVGHGAQVHVHRAPRAIGDGVRGGRVGGGVRGGKIPFGGEDNPMQHSIGNGVHQNESSTSGNDDLVIGGGASANIGHNDATVPIGRGVVRDTHSATGTSIGKGASTTGSIGAGATPNQSSIGAGVASTGHAHSIGGGVGTRI